ERCVWHGEQMSFHSRDPRGLGPVLVKKAAVSGQDDAGFSTHENQMEPYDQPAWWQTTLLPEPLRVNSGHDGSHPFITHEFVDALITDRRPRIDVREAIDYTLPGIVAHASALKQGISMRIP